MQAQAMVEIVKQLGWTYVSTLAAQGEYGEKVRRRGERGERSVLRVIRQYSGNFIVYSVGKKVRSLYRRVRDDK